MSAGCGRALSAPLRMRVPSFVCIARLAAGPRFMGLRALLPARAAGRPERAGELLRAGLHDGGPLPARPCPRTRTASASPSWTGRPSMAWRDSPPSWLFSSTPTRASDRGLGIHRLLSEHDIAVLAAVLRLLQGLSALRRDQLEE